MEPDPHFVVGPPGETYGFPNFPIEVSEVVSNSPLSEFPQVEHFVRQLERKGIDPVGFIFNEAIV
jgi:hypothetical protein